MTPTEQDKELREKIIKAIVSDPAIRIEGHHSDGTPIDEESAADAIMQLITADRKRVALESRVETVTYIDSMLRFENTPLHPVQAESLKQYLRQLEAQQELDKL